MPTQQMVFTAFLSCASDMEGDLEAVNQEIEEANSLLKDNAAHIMPVHWRRDALPMVSSSPQDAINEQLLNSADIICALFGTRAGSPTNNFDSGSIEEVITFIESNAPTAGLKSVQVYFRRERVDPFEIDLNQIALLKKFKENISNRGVLYKEYTTVDELRPLVRRSMLECVREWMSQSASKPEQFSDIEQQPQPSTTIRAPSAIAFDDDAPGFLELADEAGKASDVFNSTMDRLTKATVGLSERVHGAVTIMNNTKGVGVDVMSLFNTVADAIEECSSETELVVPIIRREFSTVIDLTYSSIEIAINAGIPDNGQLATLMSTFSEMEVSIVTTFSNVNDFRIGMENTPNFTRRIRKSSRRLSLALIELENFLSSSLDEVRRLRHNFS